MAKRSVCEDCKGGKYYMAVRNKCHKDSFLASGIVTVEAYFNEWFQKYKKNVLLFIAPSLFIKRKFVEFGWPQKSIRHVPNFVVPSEFKPSYSRGKYFLYLGRLSAEKGISTLIEAFMKADFDEVGLTIVGEGPLKDSLELLAADDPRIKFTGYLSGGTLKEITREALAVVLPSEWYENAPISILEAFAFGKPVVGSRIGGISEMIDQGVNGYLFESGNVNDLREKLELVNSLADKRISAMGRAARKKVEMEYSADVHYERLIDVYQTAMGKS